jgi:5-methylcytosine-specific restriction endonuclease McrA
MIDKLDKVFSEYIRKRDSKEYGGRYFRCISCGKVKPFEQMDCGHYIPRANMATRFDEDNCHGECVECNRMSVTHIVGFRQNLVKKIGYEAVERLEQKKHTIQKYSKTEISELIKYYKTKIKELD